MSSTAQESEIEGVDAEDVKAPVALEDVELPLMTTIDCTQPKDKFGPHFNSLSSATSLTTSELFVGFHRRLNLSSPVWMNLWRQFVPAITVFMNSISKFVACFFLSLKCFSYTFTITE